MKLLFSLLFSGLLLSPLFAFAGGRGASRSILPRVAKKTPSVESIKSGYQQLPSRAFKSLIQVSSNDPASSFLIANVAKISTNLELSGKNVEENLNALALEIELSRDATEEYKGSVLNHIKNLAENIDRATEEKQQDILRAYRIYHHYVNRHALRQGGSSVTIAIQGPRDQIRYALSNPENPSFWRKFWTQCSPACVASAMAFLPDTAQSFLSHEYVYKSDAVTVLIENVEKIYNNLELNGENAAENLNALALEIKWAGTEHSKNLLADHIRNLVEGMDKETAELQKEYLDKYWAYIKQANREQEQAKREQEQADYIPPMMHGGGHRPLPVH